MSLQGSFFFSQVVFLSVEVISIFTQGNVGPLNYTVCVLQSFAYLMSCTIFFNYIVFNDLDLTVKSQVLGNGQTYLLGLDSKNIERFRLVMIINNEETHRNSILSDRRPSQLYYIAA